MRGKMPSANARRASGESSSSRFKPPACCWHSHSSPTLSSAAPLQYSQTARVMPNWLAWSAPPPLSPRSAFLPHLRVNEVDLYYEEQGHGEPLLLIPPTGWPGSVWQLDIAEPLSQEFRVIVYD